MKNVSLEILQFSAHNNNGQDKRLPADTQRAEQQRRRKPDNDEAVRHRETHPQVDAIAVEETVYRRLIPHGEASI